MTNVPENDFYLHTPKRVLHQQIIRCIYIKTFPCKHFLEIYIFVLLLFDYFEVESTRLQFKRAY